MTDDTTKIQTETQQVVRETKTVIADLQSDETKVETLYQAHRLWVIGLGCFVLGAICGAVLFAAL